ILQSPFGEKMWGFWRAHVLKKNVLFSESAVLLLRPAYARPTHPATRAPHVLPAERPSPAVHPGVRRPEPHVFFLQAEDGIRDKLVTGVQTCALPIFQSCGLIVRSQYITLPVGSMTALI